MTNSSSPAPRGPRRGLKPGLVRRNDAVVQAKAKREAVRLETRNSPRRSQLDLLIIERGALQLKRLHRAAVIAIHPWNGSSEPEPSVPATPKEPRDPLKLARYYQSLLDSGRFENRAALARYLGVSRARVTQVLRRLISEVNRNGSKRE